MKREHLEAAERFEAEHTEEIDKLRLMYVNLEDAVYTLCEEQAPGAMTFDCLPALLVRLQEQITAAQNKENSPKG